MPPIDVASDRTRLDDSAGVGLSADEILFEALAPNPARLQLEVCNRIEGGEETYGKNQKSKHRP